MRRGPTVLILALALVARNSCAAGALPFVTDIAITRIPARAFNCV